MKLVQAQTKRLDPFPFYVHGAGDKFISPTIEKEGQWEAFETEVFSRLCTPGSIVLDAGANIGWYTIVAARLLGPTGFVISVEPDKSNFMLLQKNIEANGCAESVHARNVALGAQVGEAVLYQSTDNFGDHRMTSQSAGSEKQVVRVETIDSLFAAGHIPTLIKSDTQGSEAALLDGADRFFGSGLRPPMILEFWPFGLNEHGVKALDFFRRIASLGYGVYSINEAEENLSQLSEAEIKQGLSGWRSIEQQGYWNILCLVPGSDEIGAIGDLLI